MTGPDAALDVATRWAGGADVLRSWAWPHGESCVVALRTPRGDVVAKWVAQRPTFDREVHALRAYAPALGADTSQLVHVDAERAVLVVTMLAGELVEGSSAERAPGVHRQAGALIARLHRSAPATIDPAWGATALARFDRWARRGAGIVADDELRGVRAIVARAGVLAPVALVPAHRDNSPRNWLVHEGHVRLIDFGLCEPAPWVVDLHRMIDREWRGRPELQDAFLDGYGARPSEHDLAVLAAHDATAAATTVIWAVEHDDETFAATGRAALARVLAAD